MRYDPEDLPIYIERANVLRAEAFRTAARGIARLLRGKRPAHPATSGPASPGGAACGTGPVPEPADVFAAGR